MKHSYRVHLNGHAVDNPLSTFPLPGRFRIRA
jgi:hypothetical protein